MDEEQPTPPPPAAETPVSEAEPAAPKPAKQPRAKARRPKRQPQKAKSPSKKKHSPPQKRPYPRETLENALKVPLALKEKNGGNPWPPIDIAKALGRGPKSPDFFYMAAAARDFGLTDGGRDSAFISLTPLGREIVYPANKAEEEAKLRQALLNVEIFKKVLDHYKGSNLPEMQYVSNTLFREFGLDPSFHEEFSKLFKENCAFLKIGAGFTPGSADQSASNFERSRPAASTVVLAEPKTDTGRVCFVAMPFRERETARATGFFNEVLNALIVPAGREAGFEVVTANREGSDVIQATIVNQLLDADLVIADLTENNPNVLFELGMRIVEGKPVALIRATGTPPIFDVDNMLRVFEYNPTLWSSSIQHDLPRLTEHIKGAWENRESNASFIKILRTRAT